MCLPLPPPPVFCLKGSDGSVQSVCFFEQNLISTSVNGSIYIWDLMINRIKKTWKLENTACIWSSVRKDIPFLYIQNRSQNVFLWDMHKDCVHKIIECGHYGFCKASLGDKNLAIPGPEPSQISIFTLKGELIKQLSLGSPYTPGMLMQMFWINSDTQLLAAYESGILVLWDYRQMKTINTLKLNDTPMCFFFDNQFQEGCIGDATNEILLFRLENKSNLSIKSKLNIMNPGVSCMSVRPDSKILSIGCWDSHIRIFKWQKRQKLLACLDFHSKTIECMAFSEKPVGIWKNNHLLAAGSADATISLWDLYS